MTRPVRVPHRTLGALLFASALSIAGCSTGDPDSAVDTSGAPTTTAGDITDTVTGGDLAAFCASGETINSRTAAISSPEDAVAAFTELDPTLDDMLESAPDEVADAAAEFVSTARSSVESGDFSPFEDGTVDALTEQFAAVCAEG